MSPERHDEAQDLCQTSNLYQAGDANDSQRPKAYQVTMSTTSKV